MKKWTVDIWVTGWDGETGTSRHAEFERDDRDAAHGFGMSEIRRLIDEIEAEDASRTAPEWRPRSLKKCS